MGMKPRIEQPNKRIDPKLCSAPNTHPGEETNPNIANTVTTHKVETNKKLVPNLVSEPKKG